MSVTTNARRAHAARVGGLCLMTAAAVVIPRVALAAGAANPTIRATIGSDGTVKSVQQYAGGTSSAYHGTLPLALTITHAAAGAGQTYTYTVANTFSRTQTVKYADTAGHQHSTTLQLQLPLVAQLGIDVPKSMGTLDASGASVSTDSAGTRHVLYNLVLFSPLGSPTQSVVLTTGAAGSPVAELRASAVNPQTTSGLSRASQDATASFQQDDFWAGYAGGGNAGLSKLSAGTAQLIAGLQQAASGAQQLHDGIAAGADGANKLDAGTKKAYNGSKALSAGLQLIHNGLNNDPAAGLTGGLALIHKGLGNDPATGLTGGLRLIHNGLANNATGLTGGLTQIHAGQASLTTGLAQISGGLSQLANPSTGLAAGVAGLNQMQAGIQAMIAGVGDDATSQTLLNGVDQIGNGASALHAAFATPGTGIVTGIQCSIDVIGVMVNGNATPSVSDPCFAGPPFNGTRPVIPAMNAVSQGVVGATEAAVLQGVLTNALNPISAGLTNPNPSQGVVAGLAAMAAGASAVHAGLSHPVGAGGPTDQGGLLQGLQAVNAGLTQLLDPAAGLPAAVGGVTALAAGAQSALTGSTALTAGSAQALAGSQQLYAGSGLALAGAKKLHAGTGLALAGSRKLFAGTGTASAGAAQLKDGLRQLSDGQHQVATGLPAAVTGTAQLAAGLTSAVSGAGQIKGGIDAVQSGATGPLLKQLNQASSNAHQQIAAMGATGNLVSQAPGGVGATYVLTQSTRPVSLAATNAAATSKSSSHTGRNIGIGAGGVALLGLGIGSGFAMGRRRTAVNA